MPETTGSQIYPSLPENIHNNFKAENGTGHGMADFQHASGKFNSQTSPELQSRYPPIDDHPITEKKDYKYFWKRVLKDLTNKELIPVKILFFFKFATLFVLYPFLALHMQSLGLNEQEIGVIHAFVPLVAILGPPISGVIADKIGNFKVVLAFITLLNAAVSLLLLLIPMARETVHYPTSIMFEVACDPASHHFILSSLDPHVCSMNTTRVSNIPVSNLIQCGQLCRADVMTNETDKVDVFSELPLKPSSSLQIWLKTQSYTFQAGGLGTHPIFKCEDDFDGLSKRCQFTNIPPYQTMIDNSTKVKNFGTQNYSEFRFPGLVLMDNHASTAPRDLEYPSFIIENPITVDNQKYDNLTCSGPSLTSIPDDAGQNLNDCEAKCILQLERKLFCLNDSEQKEYNVSLSFVMYILFRVLLGLASSTSFIMFEGAVLAILKQNGGDYGLQRVTATFAAIIAAPFSGVIQQYYSFRPVFYLYAALQVVSAFLTLKIDLQFKKPTNNVLAHLKEVLTQAEILIFFAAMLISGTAWGYLETFLFLFLKKLGGTQTLMGLTITIGGIFGLPLLIFSRPITKKIGHVNVLCIGLLFYGIRYFGYSFIENPWYCLIFEALESITASLAITAAATYAVALSNLQTIVTIQGIMGGLYFGVGRGTGSLLGGFLIRNFGHRQTFQIFGVGSLIACLFYVLINIFYLRKHSSVNKKTNETNENGLVISNGSAKLNSKMPANDQIQMKPTNHDSELGYGKINPGFDDGDAAEDTNNFTDIPLNEENQSVQHTQSNNNKKASH